MWFAKGWVEYGLLFILPTTLADSDQEMNEILGYFIAIASNIPMAIILSFIVDIPNLGRKNTMFGL